MRKKCGMALLGGILVRTGSINPGPGRRGSQQPSVRNKLKHPRSQGKALNPISFLGILFWDL